MSAWVLPDHIADVLPSEARHIEELRRSLLDTARSYGYELVMPPLLEHLESLLSRTNEALDLQTFKLVDQLSGRSLGLRADSTPQVARIDAHLLNKEGVTRLCYCGPVAHTRPDRPRASRELLQFGAEIYGYSGLEADLEIVQLALDCLNASGVRATTIDLADVRIVNSILPSTACDEVTRASIQGALAAKDSSEIRALSRDLPRAVREALQVLVSLYGDKSILKEALKNLSEFPEIPSVLHELEVLASQLDGASVIFDLADLRGYAYYSGIRFSIYGQGRSDALARGGRYDRVGAVFGRSRPAAGFSLDIKQLVSATPPLAGGKAIRSPWPADQNLRRVIAKLRDQGESVVCTLPGMLSDPDAFDFDRELIFKSDQWIVENL